jgi:putative heme-binding domain-containing protein
MGNSNDQCLAPINVLKAHEEAMSTMTPDEIVALGDVLAAYLAGQARKPAPPLSNRKLVKEWTTADLQSLLGQVGQRRNFNRGREVFYEAQCSACHRYGDQGGAIGPDLTAVSTRFKRQDLLESMTEPSKVLSEQYTNTAIETDDGRVVIGRVVEESPEKVVIRANPLEEKTVTIAKNSIEKRSPSKISPMPTGLLNTFNTTDILDLLAYMESLGDPKHPNFAKQRERSNASEVAFPPKRARSHLESGSQGAAFRLPLSAFRPAFRLPPPASRARPRRASQPLRCLGDGDRAQLAESEFAINSLWSRSDSRQ